MAPLHDRMLAILSYWRGAPPPVVAPAPPIADPPLTREDAPRIDLQRTRVCNAMMDGEWHTLRHVARIAGAPEASASARLRDLRKQRYGLWIVDRRRIAGERGLFEYRMRPGIQNEGAD